MALGLLASNKAAAHTCFQSSQPSCALQHTCCPRKPKTQPCSCPWSALAFGPSLAPLPWVFQNFALVAMSRFLSFWGWEQDGGEIRKGSVNVGKGSLLQLSTPLPALGLVPGMLCWAYGLVRDSLSIPGFMYFPLFCLIPDISDLQVCPQLSVFQPLEVGRGIMGFSYCSMECSTCSHASEQILQPWGTHTLQGTEF